MCERDGNRIRKKSRNFYVIIKTEFFFIRLTYFAFCFFLTRFCVSKKECRTKFRLKFMRNQAEVVCSCEIYVKDFKSNYKNDHFSYNFVSLDFKFLNFLLFKYFARSQQRLTIKHRNRTYRQTDFINLL